MQKYIEDGIYIEKDHEQTSTGKITKMIYSPEFSDCVTINARLELILLSIF